VRVVRACVKTTYVTMFVPTLLGTYVTMFVPTRRGEEARCVMRKS
jgi:hypothetical protein